MPLEHEQKAARDLFAKLGEAATYTPPGGVAVTLSGGAIVHPNLELFLDPDRPTIAQRRTVVAVLVEDLPEPQRDGVLVVAGLTYRVESRLTDDRLVIDLLVR